eukprot:2332317-Rhodomonas_salina.2
MSSALYAELALGVILSHPLDLFDGSFSSSKGALPGEKWCRTRVPGYPGYKYPGTAVCVTDADGTWVPGYSGTPPNTAQCSQC